MNVIISFNSKDNYLPKIAYKERITWFAKLKVEKVAKNCIEAKLTTSFTFLYLYSWFNMSKHLKLKEYLS